MNSVICTLFEGRYHLGLAGLTNSLVKNEYKGEIYAGYKGVLPEWAADATENPLLKWKGSKSLHVTDEVRLHFLPIETGSHFANYKPDFMLDLLNGDAASSENIFYFDPDIVVMQNWLLYEEWVTCGIALNEDVNSPLEEHHPRRVAWRRYFGEKGITLRFKNNIYVNSGFVGIHRSKMDFLKVWKQNQTLIAPLTGGLNISIFKKEDLKHLENVGGPFMPFVTTDQDALNIAIEICEDEISFIGKEGMGFEIGLDLMQHAIGLPKPWNWNVLIQSIDGRPPRKVDIEFWNIIRGPVKAVPSRVIFLKNFAIKLAIALGRFYKRN